MMTIEERRHAAIVEVSLRRLCEAVESLVARIADLAASIDAAGMAPKSESGAKDGSET